MRPTVDAPRRGANEVPKGKEVRPVIAWILAVVALVARLMALRTVFAF